MPDAMELKTCDERMATCYADRKKEVSEIHNSIATKISSNIFWMMVGAFGMIVIGAISAQVWNITGITRNETQIADMASRLPAMAEHSTIIARNTARLDNLELNRDELNRDMKKVLEGIATLCAKMDAHLEASRNGTK